MTARHFGVLGLAFSDVELKRAALLFDVVLCERAVGDVAEAIRLGILRDDLTAWRRGTGVPQPSHTYDPEALRDFETVNEKLLDQVKFNIAFGQAVRRLREASADTLRPGTAATAIDLIDIADRRSQRYGDVFARVNADILAKLYTSCAFVPLVRGVDLPEEMLAASRANVLRLVLPQLPMPNEATPWDAIADWRADTEVRAKYQSLHTWIGRVSRQQLSSADIEDELTSMIDAYNQYMAIQHKKMSRSKLEIFVVSLLEATESALKLRLSKAASALFSVGRAEVGILEAELGAPGREIAYITAARQHFSSTAA